MSRELDLKWFEANRNILAHQYLDNYLVVLDEKVIKYFEHEVDAIYYMIDNFGIDSASVFRAYSFE